MALPQGSLMIGNTDYGHLLMESAMPEKIDPERELFAPVLPVLEQFARQHGVNLYYEIPDRYSGEGCFRLFWLNVSGCSCYLSIFYREPEAFLFWVVCWGIHNKLGEKTWEIVPKHHIDVVVPPLLQEAFQWSDAFKQQT